MDWYTKVLSSTAGILATIVSSVLLSSMLGCSKPSKESLISKGEEIVDTAVYIMDPQTKLCFAVFNATYSYRNSTNVPCTPEVLAEIAKNHSKE